MAGAAHAQFDLARTPGAETPTLAEETDRGAALERAIEEARWKLGALRLHPWLAVKDTAYVDNVYATLDGDQESDLTTTLGLGLRGYVPLGEHAAFAVHALPEYVWWQSLEHRRRLNGRYGAGVFVFGNRLDFELAATREDAQGVVSPEQQQWSSSRIDALATAFDVSVYRSLGLFARASTRDYTHLLGEQRDDERTAAFYLLDREETLLAAGLRLRLGESARLLLGVERSEVEFAAGADDRSNEGDSPLLELLVDGGVRVSAKFAHRELAPRGPHSRFEPYSDLTGSLQVTFLPQRRLSFGVSAARNLIYTIGASTPYFIDDAYGATLGVALGERTSLRAYIEAGEHDYTAAGSRRDDTLAYGVDGELSLGLGTKLVLAAGVADYDSNVDAFDRSISFIRFGVLIGEIAWP